MTNVASIVQQLKRERDRLSRELRGITAAIAAFGAAYGRNTGRRRLSASARARIAAAQRARWAKAKSGQKQNVVTMPKKRAMSASARRKIAAAQRTRWAKVKAQKKSA
jgi:hypothetical protein